MSRRPALTLYYSQLETGTPIGKLTLAVSEKGLAILTFNEEELPPSGARFAKWEIEWVHSEKHTARYARHVMEYLRGKRKDFELDIDLRFGTEFQQRCWKTLTKIPFGKTCSYADIARKVGSGKGFRAVGQTNNRNPVALVVPCHRVIQADKTLGGYGGGLPKKEWLLKLEGASWTPAKQKAVKARAARA